MEDGFAKVLSSEIPARLERIRTEMAKREVDLLVLTGRESFEYFTGFESMFWASTSRPFFALIDQSSARCVVIASRSEELNAASDTSLNRFVFYDGFMEAAVGTMAQVAAKLARSTHRIAIDYGEDAAGRGSLRLLEALTALPGSPELVEGSELIWAVRSLKTEYEIDIKRRVTRIATDSFFAALDKLRLGATEKEFAGAITTSMLTRDADGVDWLPVRFAQSDFCYTRPPTRRALQKDDFIWADMGCLFRGYHSDINRVAKAGVPSREQGEAHRFVRDVTVELAKMLRPGMACSEVMIEYRKLWGKGAFGEPYRGAGRIGHGSGIGLTEPPSIMDSSREIIQSGMIIHLEPKVETLRGVFQGEEVVVVRENGVEFLSELAPSELPSIPQS